MSIILTDNKGLNRLIDNLNTLKNHPKIEMFSNLYEGKRWITTTLPQGKEHSKNNKDIIDLIDQIEHDLCGLLITNNGHHHYSNRTVLIKSGYTFEPGESDSFGPLTSVIVIGNYRLCYG